MMCKCVKGIKRNPVSLARLTTLPAWGGRGIRMVVTAGITLLVAIVTINRGTEMRLSSRRFTHPYLWRNNRRLIIDSMTKTTFCLPKRVSQPVRMLAGRYYGNELSQTCLFHASIACLFACAAHRTMVTYLEFAAYPKVDARTPWFRARQGHAP